MPKRLLSLLVLALSLAASAQTLARPGWVGSGMNVEPWWTHAVLYQIDPHRFTGDGLKGTTSKLDYIHSLGVDAIALSHVQDATATYAALDGSLGTLDDFDDLVREASRSGIRVLMELDPAASDAGKAARFWLAHGVAGISLRPGPVSAGQVQTMREVTRSFAGQRVLIAEAASEDAAVRHGDSLVLTMLGGTLDATALRSVLTHLSATEGVRPLVGMEPSTDAAAGKVIAALLLATHTNAQLRFGQEIGMATESTMVWGDTAKPGKPGTAEVAAQEGDSDSLLNWYHRLIDLHHGNGVIRSGAVDFLNRDAQNSLVWVMRKSQVTPLAPALIFACNLSDKPVTLSLTDDLHALHLRGSFLRTLARSDKALGGVSLNAVTLPPFGVYIGELRF